MTPENFLTNIKNDNDKDKDTGESKLLSFDDTKVASGNDINTKITALDTDLAQLRMELGTINNSVEEGLDRLGDTDTDLTAKVSETYKRLGEIDNAYKSLIAISTRIDRDIQKLNGDVSSVAEQSATGIKHLEQSTIAQSHDFTERNQQVATRVSQLVETSKLSSDLMSQKIQTTTQTMLLIEKKVVAEIDSLASSTKDKTDSIEVAVDNTKAKIIKLQSIDEAIIRRATTLEITSAELTVAGQYMGASIEQLELSSEVMTHGIDKLKSRTDALEALTSSHGSLIGGLQKVTVDISDKLATLAGRERKHFNIITGGFLLLLIATGIIYVAQQDQFADSDIKLAEQSEIVDSKIISLSHAQELAAVNTNESIAALEDKIAQVNSSMQDEIKKEIAQVDYKMQEVEDQLQSVEGRFNESTPFSQIGNDNVIHSAQWIAELPSVNYSVQLALTDNKNEMFEIAQRYNHYLKNALFYFEVKTGDVTKYALMSGSYVSQEQAFVAIKAMPAYISMQRPVVRSLDTVQKFIAKK